MNDLSKITGLKLQGLLESLYQVKTSIEHCKVHKQGLALGADIGLTHG